MDTKIIQKKFDVNQLKMKLWSGFSSYAVSALKALINNNSTSAEDKKKALWDLACWHIFSQNYTQALEYLDQIDSKNCDTSKAYIIARVLCFFRLGNYIKANEYIDQVIKDQFRIFRSEKFRSFTSGYLFKLRSSSMNGRYLNKLIELFVEDSDLCLLKSTALGHIVKNPAQSKYLSDSIRLEWINKVFLRSNLSLIEKKNASNSLSIFNITTKLDTVRKNQKQKVSIIMPVFNTDKTIRFAIDSLVNQSWKNIEIVIADDNSTDNSCEIIMSYMEFDSRIKLIRQSINKGCYAARNLALQHISGDLVMAHDGDDWSHPQKVELLVNALSRDSRIKAVLSNRIRIKENMEIAGPLFLNKSITDSDLSSLLVRKSVFDEIGKWDEVRVSGDSEFRHRILSYYGDDSIKTLHSRYILSFALSHDKSLCNSEKTHVKSLFFGLRWQYRDSYLYWHSSEIFKKNTRLENGRKYFPVPVGNHTYVKDIHQYDYVVISDYALVGGALISTLNYIIAASMMGKKVAVFHWRRYDLPNAHLARQFYDTCLRYNIDILTADDTVETEVVIFGYPVILQYMIDAAPKINTKHLIIIINQFASRMIDGEDPQYNPVDVKNHLVKLFGQEGVWVPISGLVLRLMKNDQRYPEPYAIPWHSMIDTNTWCRSPLRWRGKERKYPVVGRHGRDHYTKWPTDLQSVKEAYGIGQKWEIRILGGANKVLKRLGKRPSNWHIRKFDSMDVYEFLIDLDFYVHYPHEKYIEEFGRGVMEAMAVGIPVILPSQFREIYGNAALYAKPSQVSQKIIDYWSSPDKYIEQAQIGRNFVIENCDIGSFDRRIRRLVDSQCREVDR